MNQKYKKLFLVLTIIICLLFGSVLQIKNSEAANPEPFFYISILAPVTTSRSQWSTLMVELLPKIGIGIDIFDHTSWSQIIPRTWDYPGPYPIPTYENGGFDILVVGWGWSLDWDPTGLYDTAGIVPFGDNFYQYSNPEMDWAIGNYTATYTTANRIEYAKDIQALLYEDLPQITIFYPRSLYPYAEGFTGWDGLLWASSYQPMENWSLGSETEFHYGVPAGFDDCHIYHYESVYDAYWLRQIYNGLIERQPGTRQWGNRLATSFTSTDGLTWLVDINTEAKWADGTALTAYDVNYSYNLIINPNFGHQDLNFWETYIDHNTVNVINDYQVEFTFLQPYVFQESNLALDLLPEHIWNSILPEDHRTQAITWAASDPSKLLGAGPYYLEDYDGSSQIIHLKANEYFDDWSGVTPNFDDIYFEFYSNKEGALSALAAGALDMVDSQFSPQLAEVTDLPGVIYELVPDPGVQELGINMEHPYLGTGESCPIADEASANHIRKAISHMVPRDTIVKEILDGIGVPGVTGMPDVAVGYDDSLEPYEYSIQLAKNEMRAAGFEFPEDIVNSPTTIILGISSKSIICSLTLVVSLIVIVRYKNRKWSFKK
ncbi:MAG: ABC transporter substrate-binding protein [Candidatus Heimdallarchaeota archaeon]